MEGERDEACFPPNFKTLAHLRDEWIKEHESEQIQEDNQYRERQRHQEREKAERDRKQRDDLNYRKQKDSREVATPHPRNRRYQHHPKPPIEAVVVNDVAQTADKSKQKKKKSNWDKQKAKSNEPRAEGQGTGGTAEVEPEERAERVVTEKLRRTELPRSNFRGNWVDQRGNRWIEKQKVSGDDKTSSIVQTFEAFTVNGGKEGNVRSQEGRNGRYSNWSNGRGFGRFDVRYDQLCGRRDGNYLWVKKGTDAGVNGVQCSGTFNMDQGNIRQSTQRS